MLSLWSSEVKPQLCRSRSALAFLSPFTSVRPSCRGFTSHSVLSPTVLLQSHSSPNMLSCGPGFQSVTVGTPAPIPMYWADLTSCSDPLSSLLSFRDSNCTYFHIPRGCPLPHAFAHSRLYCAVTVVASPEGLKGGSQQKWAK